MSAVRLALLFTVFALTSVGTATAAFDPPVSYPAGTTPEEVALGDLDNDGDQDAVTTNSGTSTLGVLLNQGDGTFGPATQVGAGAGVRGIETADFNEDGDLDLVIANPNNNSISILLGNGDGTFQPRTNFLADGGVNVAVGDYNEDGNVDVVTASRSSSASSITLRPGNGSGGLGSATAIPFNASGSSTIGLGAQDVAAGDMNNDGNLDIAVTADPNSSTSNRVVAMFGNGDLTFGTSGNRAVTYNFPVESTVTNDIVLGRFNGDDFLDIAANANDGTIGDTTGDGAVVFLNNGGNGRTFAAGVLYAAGDGPISLETGDFTEDGVTDIVAANVHSDNLSILPGTGTGSFGPPDDIPGVDSNWWVQSGNLNGDSVTDLITADRVPGTVTVHLSESNLVTPTLSGSATSSTTVGGPISATATIADGESPTGTISFMAYARSDSNCSGEPVFTVTQNVTGNATYQSGDYATTGVGTYRWVVQYSGDDGNAAAMLPCGELASVTQKAAPTMTAEATPTAAAGEAIRSEATIAGGYEPSGTIRFTVYGPDDPDCEQAPIFASEPVVVEGAGTYPSPDFTPPTAGEYQWVADYSGTDDNLPVSGACGEAEQTSTVEKARPQISGTAMATGLVGFPVADAASLTGGHEATGTLTFAAYGPGDADCSGAPAFTSAEVGVNGDGSYGSPHFTPQAAGDYNWVATYSGDANNEAASTACGAAGQTTAVSADGPAPPPPLPAQLSISTLQPRSKTVKGGKAATFKVTVSNTGGEAATGVKVCPKAGSGVKKRGFKPGGCVSLGSIGAGEQKTAGIRVKAKKKAKGSAKVSVQVSSGSGGGASATVTVKAKGA